jgi:hypothetical protein
MGTITTARAGNVIVPYQSATKRTRQVNIGSSVTPSVGTISSSQLLAIFYADSSGNWRMQCSGKIDFTGNVDFTSQQLTFAIGANFSSIEQLFTLVGYSSGYGTAYQLGAKVESSNFVSFLTPSTTVRYLQIDADVALAGEPTTYTTPANMEGVVAADVYVEPAAVGTAGLINNAAGNTAGNPLLGKKDGVAVAAGYVGEKILGTINAGALPLVSYAGVAQIVLNKGVYMLCHNLALTVSGTISPWNLRSEPYISIGFRTSVDVLSQSETLVRHVFVASSAQDEVYVPPVTQYVNVTQDNTTFYAVAYMLANVTGGFTVYNNGGFYAVRIA